MEEKIATENKNIFSNLIINETSSIILITDENANIIFANPTITKVLGYSVNELIGTGWWEKTRNNQDDVAEFKKYVSDCAKGIKEIDTKTYINSLLDKSGNKRYIQWQDSLLMDGYIIGVGQDVTEEKTNEQIIIEQNKQLELLSLVANNTDNVILILNSKGDLIWVSDSFERFHGLTLNQFISQRGKNITQISNNKNIKNYFEICVAEKKSFNYESINKYQDTKEIWGFSTMSPILDEDGNVKYIIIVDSDISDQKKIEKELSQVNKDITDSLVYANRIQSFLFPELPELKKYFSDCYLLYKPKEIISGDFYWYHETESQFYFAIGDCTGHGIPAAMMSMIGITLLNRYTKANQFKTPAKVISSLFNNLNTLFKKTYAVQKLNDSMD
ncbi:MAG: PAS domain S-box protein [Bacteroidetes bacterium]|nr:PAS domain S-box protein [Bacteroidota bacterium]